MHISAGEGGFVLDGKNLVRAGRQHVRRLRCVMTSRAREPSAGILAGLDGLAQPDQHVGERLLLCGGEAFHQNSGLEHGYYIQPTLFKGHNKMRIFQEEIFGPVSCVTTFKTTEEAIDIANDTLYGLGAGVWTRDLNTAYRFGRGIKAGRVWTNCYHAYPAHAAFGGYKKSGIGRETHKMMLDHYQQTKNMLVSYSEKALGFF